MSFFLAYLEMRSSTSFFLMASLSSPASSYEERLGRMPGVQRITNWKNDNLFGRRLCVFPPKNLPLSTRGLSTLIKNKRKFSSYIRKFRGIGCTVILYMTNDLLTYGENICAFPHICIRKPFLVYDFAPDPICISLYMKKILFSFLSVYLNQNLDQLWFFYVERRQKKFSSFTWVFFACGAFLVGHRTPGHIALRYLSKKGYDELYENLMSYE